MSNRFVAGLALMGLLLLVSCDNKMSNMEQPQISIMKISSSELPHPLDTSRTYYFPSNNPNPEALLIAAFKQGIPISQAWLPLNDLCANPVGPHFTVELITPDSRILSFGFVQGTDMLACSTELNRYTIS